MQRKEKCLPEWMKVKRPITMTRAQWIQVAFVLERSEVLIYSVKAEKAFTLFLSQLHRIMP